MTRVNAARSGNALSEMSLVIARLDKFSRDEELQAKLKQTDWDLVVIDESHKCSHRYSMVKSNIRSDTIWLNCFPSEPDIC